MNNQTNLEISLMLEIRKHISFLTHPKAHIKVRKFWTEIQVNLRTTPKAELKEKSIVYYTLKKNNTGEWKLMN